MRPPFLNVDELAAWLGIEVVFVRRLIAERRIPFVKVGRLVRFDPEEILAWIDGRRVAVEEERSRPMNFEELTGCCCARTDRSPM